MLGWGSVVSGQPKAGHEHCPICGQPLEPGAPTELILRVTEVIDRLGIEEDRLEEVGWVIVHHDCAHGPEWGDPQP